VEDRALVRAELTGALVEDFRADDVRRQEVNRELHALKRRSNGGGPMHSRAASWPRPGHALEQQVAARDNNAISRPLDHRVLDRPRTWATPRPHGFDELRRSDGWS